MPVTFTWSVVASAPAPQVQDEPQAVELVRDIALNLLTGELDLTSGGLRLTRGAVAVAQSLYIRLRFFRGEHYRDLEAGTPYLEDVLVKNPQAELLRSVFRERIAGTQDVLEVTSLELDYQSAARHLEVEFSVSTPFGDLRAVLEATP